MQPCVPFVMKTRVNNKTANTTLVGFLKIERRISESTDGERIRRCANLASDESRPMTWESESLGGDERVCDEDLQDLPCR